MSRIHLRIHKDWSTDKKLSSWVSTAPTHNTNIMSICFIRQKGTIENRRKWINVRVFQKYQLCVSYIYISLQSPLTKLLLKEYSLRRCREESLAVASSNHRTDKVLPVCCITKRILRDYRVQEVETSNEAVKWEDVKRKKDTQINVLLHGQFESPAVLLPGLVNPLSLLHAC